MHLKYFFDAVEWGDSETYFIIEDEVIKLIEVKFKEGVNPEELLTCLKGFPHIRELRLIKKNDHYLLYTRASIKNSPFPKESIDRILKLQKKGLVIFEKSTFDGISINLYVICEDSLLPEVLSVLREVYGGSLLSIEDYTPRTIPS